MSDRPYAACESPVRCLKDKAEAPLVFAAGWWNFTYLSMATLQRLQKGDQLPFLVRRQSQPEFVAGNGARSFWSSPAVRHVVVPQTSRIEPVLEARHIAS